MGRVSAISKVSPSRFRSATQAGNLLGGSLLGGSLLLGTVTGQRNDAATSGFWVWASSPGCKWRISCKSDAVVGYAISRSTWQRTQRFGFCEAASDLSDT